MRKRNNNGGKHRQGGGRRFHTGGGGNRDHQNLARQKHHATQMREKYMNHARDAQNNGDRVDVEYYLQHVDHYNRVLADIATIEAERQAQRQDHLQHPPEGGHGGAGEAENADAAADNNAGGQSGDTVADEPVTPGNQPRMTRGPRRNAPAKAPRGEANAAPAEAAAEGGEIPLPGGVLGAL